MDSKNRKKPAFARYLLITAAVGLVVGLVAGGGVVTARLLESKAIENEAEEIYDTAQNADLVSPTSVPVEQVAVSSTDVSAIVENVMPAIVTINSTIVTTTTDIFGREYQYEGTGSGSGIIIGQNNTELLIATNAHVVDGASDIEVSFIDESTIAAELKGIDTTADLAVISIPLEDLSDDTISSIKIATLGDSDSVETGSMAIAIGNALGYGQSVTVGYISATNREVTIDDVTMTLLQTDAAINPGNSGGALLNSNGEVIGINSVKFASTEVEGMGYAIPISSAVPIINDLMNREELSDNEAGYLGITGRDVSNAHASLYNIPIGIYVDSVVNGSPAEDAGIKSGDIIQAVNGRTVTTKDELQAILDSTRAGTTVAITVQRLENNQYQEIDIDVLLGNR